MRALSKPLSSPGRAEKFPPPLMRFLRTNPGSRSRGRSRSSPIFHLRSRRRPPGGAIEAAQEPSSPKVTCIGQVRVRRRKTGATPAVDLRLRRRHWLSCGKISCAFPRKLLGRFFRSMFRSNCCGEGDFRVYSDRKFGGNENCSVAGNSNNNNNNNNDGHNRARISISSGDGETDFYRRGGSKFKEIEDDGFHFQSSKRELLESSPPSSRSPPRNALLLTRCRSAPYRSSSLGGRFWAEEKGEIISKLSEENSAIDEPNEENSEEIGKRVEDDLKNGGNCKEVSGPPLLLTRCKSEPAWRGEKLGVVVDDKDNDDDDTVKKG
ncbi:Unknown protein [Striga hermonthica]|uniref:Uncharacterized protein n=1 Tax=Striga hermonthica TaxID=68872 RepID=A0A9N7NPT8_STRHE|nr:Unknown protein [Striga hermonthica]